MTVPTLRGGGLPAARLLAAAVLLAILAPLAGCGGPRVKGGNLKEQRERRRAYEEARRQVEEAEAVRGAAAADTQTEGDTPQGEAATPEAEPATPEPVATSPEAAAAVPQAPAAAPRAEPGPAPGAPGAPVAGGTLAALGPPFQATVSGPAGERRLLLYQPLIGHQERQFLMAGGVQDREVMQEMLVFRRELSLFRRKLKKLDRVVFLADPEAARSGRRVRLHFRKRGKKPEEFPLDELVGADHPSPPFLTGVGPTGTFRIPLFGETGERGEELLELDLTPEGESPAESG